MTLRRAAEPVAARPSRSRPPLRIAERPVETESPVRPEDRPDTRDEEADEPVEPVGRDEAPLFPPEEGGVRVVALPVEDEPAGRGRDCASDPDDTDPDDAEPDDDDPDEPDEEPELPVDVAGLGTACSAATTGAASPTDTSMLRAKRADAVMGESPGVRFAGDPKGEGCNTPATLLLPRAGVNR